MDQFDRPRQTLAVAVAFLAGFIDALGFLSGDRYFVSFMSGNTTRLAVDLATDPSQAIVPAMLIAGFVAGVAGGSVIATASGTRRKPVLLATVATLLCAAAVLHHLAMAGASLAAMVLAMGTVNNTFQRNGSVAVGLTYMTGALVRFGQAIGGRIMGQRGEGGAAYALLWAGLLMGGISGAILFTRVSEMAFWGVALFAAILAGIALRLTKRVTS